jgi:hypothetical protein
MKTTTTELNNNATDKNHLSKLNRKLSTHNYLLQKFLIRETESDRRMKIFGMDPLK